MRSQRKLYVLVACEESQAECKAFRALGHIAYSCDLQRCKRGEHPEWHIKGDVSPLLNGKRRFVTQDGVFRCVPKWDLIIAHPPCTYLCKVGALHLYKNPDCYVSIQNQLTHVNCIRWASMQLARQFFLSCLNASADYVAVENPCPMAAADLPPADFFICPSWYGYKYTKKTYYWVKNLPPLMANYINPDAVCMTDHTRGKYRSRTFSGLAAAMAEQWSEYILNS